MDKDELDKELQRCRAEVELLKGQQSAIAARIYQLEAYIDALNTEKRMTARGTYLMPRKGRVIEVPCIILDRKDNRLSILIEYFPPPGNCGKQRWLRTKDELARLHMDLDK